MNTSTLYCDNCKKTYNVRKEDLELMKKYDKNFNEKEYTKGCFFKDLRILKKSINGKINKNTMISS